MKKTFSLIATFLAMLPATALAEGGYVDSGCDCGAAAGTLVIMLIMVVMLIAAGGRQ